MSPLFAFSIFSLLSDLIAKLGAIIQTCFNAVWSVLLSIVSGVISYTVSLFPTSATVGTYRGQFQDTVRQVMCYANSWVALDAAVTLFGVYCSLYVGLQIYRVIKSWVPTLSG